MEIAPAPWGMSLLKPLNVAKTFVKLQEVSGDVACLDLGRKYIEHRAILKINAVNFSLMSEEEQEGIIEGFQAFLNGISFPIQILIRNRPHNLSSYLRKLEENAQGDLQAVARDHVDFVRRLAAQRALVVREYYLIVPADHQNTKNRMEALLNAQMQIKLRVEELGRQFERMGLTAQRLTNMEIIALYQSCLTPLEADRVAVTEAMLEGTQGLMVNAGNPQGEVHDSLTQSLPEQQVAVERLYNDFKSRYPQKSAKKPMKPEEKLPGFVRVSELVTPTSIQLFPSYIRIDGQTRSEYTRTLAITSYPRSAYPGWFDNLTQIDEPHVDFCIHITPLSPEQVSARLGRKAVEFRGSVIYSQREGKSADPSTTIALEDVEHLRENLARGNERVFSVSGYIQIRGTDRQSLMERSDRVTAAVRSLDFRALPTHWQHHIGLMSCLPDGNNLLARSRLLGTNSASSFFPFTGNNISMDTGVMFGVHPKGGLIIINPFDTRQLENANMVVFAKSGAGKSFFLKTVSSRLLSDCNIYVIDPEAEYDNLCQQVKGQLVRLSSQSMQINPFELHTYTKKAKVADTEEVQKEDANFFREKLLNLITLFELLLSDDRTLPQKEKAFLYKCLIRTYENRGITMDPTTHRRQPPNMQEFFVIMSSALRGDERFNLSEDTYGLSERLERYLHMFPTRTRLAMSNRFIDFNIRELNDALKPIGLFMITEFLWAKMRQARSERSIMTNSIILIDEAWLLMQFSQGAKFLEELSRRIRKYGGGLWCTTQNSDDFLSSEEGKTILAMATMKFLMKQDSSTIDSVVNTFNLSQGQRRHLLAAKRGEGLFATKTWTPMEVLASPLEIAMANTTLVSRLSTLEQQRQFMEEDLLHLANITKEDGTIRLATEKLAPQATSKLLSTAAVGEHSNGADGTNNHHKSS
ncbi:MAG: ATP-binding protein [Ktedonobacteraceae bacterium]|nr:ATP-binding protein [Ktedonobacteraceae bacterium]